MYYRQLTTGERDLVKSIFGNNINFDAIKIYNDTWIITQGSTYAMSPNGNIYFGSDVYQNDFSLLGKDRQAFFIHEMTHVWQYQNGVNVIGESIFNQAIQFGSLGMINMYSFTFDPNKNFNDYNIEQQAEIVAGYFAAKNGQAYKNAPTNADAYITILPFLKKTGDVNGLIAAEKAIVDNHNSGNIISSIFSNISNFIATALVDIGAAIGFIASGISNFFSSSNAPSLAPIGAFYESASVAFDPASTIAAKTGRVFAASTTNGVTTYAAQTAAQLAALDTNKDGKLTGTELGTLFIFQDINENGTSDTGELKSLTAAGVTAIRSTDYGLYSAGSARLGGAE